MIWFVVVKNILSGMFFQKKETIPNKPTTQEIFPM